MERINDILDRRWLTNDGAYNIEFERRLAERVGVRHCITLCNATIALEVVIKALGLTGEVILPSFTFVATAHALKWQEVTPVFCDIDPRTHNIDASRIEALITPRTSGIIGVHVWGRPCDVGALQAVASARRLELIFDAAHAFGVRHEGRAIGNFGRAEVFSFHATKMLNSFEGGAIATNDDELAKRIRLMRNFGFVNYDAVGCIGTNGKMSEVSAAMGLTGLESFDEFVSDNRVKHGHYRQVLAQVPGIDLVDFDQVAGHTYQYAVTEVEESETRLTRDELFTVLHSENVIARRYFHPGCHRMEPYRSQPSGGDRLAATEWLCSRVLVLPTGAAVTLDDIDRLGQLLLDIRDRADDLKTALTHLHV